MTGKPDLFAKIIQDATSLPFASLAFAVIQGAETLKGRKGRPIMMAHTTCGTMMLHGRRRRGDYNGYRRCAIRFAS